jgi:hypothetical protein
MFSAAGLLDGPIVQLSAPSLTKSVEPTASETVLPLLLSVTVTVLADDPGAAVGVVVRAGTVVATTGGAGRRPSVVDGRTLVVVGLTVEVVDNEDDVVERAPDRDEWPQAPATTEATITAVESWRDRSARRAMLGSY